MMPRELLVQDRNRDRHVVLPCLRDVTRISDGETTIENRVAKTLGSAFAQETLSRATEKDLFACPSPDACKAPYIRRACLCR